MDAEFPCFVGGGGYNPPLRGVSAAPYYYRLADQCGASFLLDRGKKGIGRWFAKERFLANTIFALFVVINICLIVIGTFFRGANWQFVMPF